MLDCTEKLNIYTPKTWMTSCAHLFVFVMYRYITSSAALTYRSLNVLCVYNFMATTGCQKVGAKFPQFSRLFQRYNYTFPEFMATQILAIWQHLGRFLATFSPRMHRNSYFSWQGHYSVRSWFHLPSQRLFYANIGLYFNYFICYNFSLRLHRIPWEFQELSRFREFPKYSRFVATLYNCDKFHLKSV